MVSSNKKNTERSAVLLVFAVNAVIAAVCLAFFSPMAINNDDSIIHGITSGAYGEYSSVTAHTNAVFAALLSLLQRIVPALNWFAVFEILLVFLSFSLISGVIVLNNRNLFGICLAASVCIAAAPDFYVNIHNTKLTPVAAAAGLCALIFGLSRRNRFFCVCGVTAALFASFMRFGAFLLGAAFAAGMGLAVLLKDMPNVLGSKKISGIFRHIFRSENRRLLSGLIAFCAAAAVFAGADALIIGGIDGGTEYREYNAARGGVSDFALPDYYEYAENYMPLGISENDYRIINEWNFSDFEKFSVPVLSEIAAVRQTVPRHNAFPDFAEQLLSNASDRRFWFPAVLIALCLVIGKKNNRVAAVWPLFAYCLGVFYMCLVGRTTHWVISGLFGCLLLTPAAAFETGPRGITADRRVLPAVLLSAALAVSVLAYLPLASSERGTNPAAVSIFETLAEKDENLYLFDHATSPSVALHRIFPVFSAIPKGYFGNTYALGGWDSNSPAKNGVLSRYGVGLSPYRALLELNNVFLVDTMAFDSKLTYIRENYDGGASMSLVEVIDGYFVFGFAKGAGAFPDTVRDENLIITDTAISPDETLTDFTYLGAAVNTGADGISAAYLKVTDSAAGSVRYYRARTLTQGDGLAVVCSVPFTDVLYPEDCSVTAVFLTDGGFACTGDVPLVS